MADGDKKVGLRTATGTVEGTGSLIDSIVCGFRPSHVIVRNVDGEASLHWNNSMDDDAGYKELGTAAGEFTGTADVAPLIVEEVVSVVSDVGTLANAPAYIVAVDVTAGGTTGPFSVIPTGETAATTQTAVTFTDGTMTFAAADTVSSVRVTYFPKRPGTLFQDGNFTVDEVAVASASKVNLASRAALVQYVYDTTGGTVLTPIPPGEAPASGEYALDINDSGNTSIDTNADIDGNNLKVTYMPFANISVDMFIDDTDITLVSEAYNFVSSGGYNGLIVPGHGVHVVGEAAASNESPLWGGPSVTAADGLARWRPNRNEMLTNQTLAMLTTAMSWVIVTVNELAGRTPAGTFTGAVEGAAFITSDGITPRTDGFNIGADADINVSAETIYWTALTF